MYQDGESMDNREMLEAGYQAISPCTLPSNVASMSDEYLLEEIYLDKYPNTVPSAIHVAEWKRRVCVR